MEDFWYEIEENCQYGIWKNRLPFHTMPCQHEQMNRLNVIVMIAVTRGGVLEDVLGFEDVLEDTF